MGHWQKEALEIFPVLKDGVWKAGCFEQFQGKPTPPFLQLPNGKQDQILQSLVDRGLVLRIGEDQYGMGIYRLKGSE